MPEPLVSILIPCFNAEQFVVDAIESALSQTYRNIEVIVIDDGSTDGSLDVIKKFDHHIRWETGPNRGACAARNRALELSRGSFIQFLDADDTLFPNKIEFQIDQLADGRHDLSFCRALIHDAEQGRDEPCGFYPDPSGMDPLLYTVRYTLGTNGPLQRRDVLQQVGGFRLGIPKAQETEMHWRLGAAGVRLIKTDEILCMKRNHGHPRISNSVKIGNDYILLLFAINALEMEIRGQLYNPDRRNLVAGNLCELADIAHRHGLTQSSAIGFALAEHISNSNICYSDVRWKYFLVRVLGSPWRAAEVMRWGRLLRSALIPSYGRGS